MEKALPPIPAKRYFTIGEVSDLCGVKPYVLRYWEQEFTQLKPMKRRGNRRYYQHHEVLLVRRIRELLYEQGFTISGARNRLTDAGHTKRDGAQREDAASVAMNGSDGSDGSNGSNGGSSSHDGNGSNASRQQMDESSRAVDGNAEHLLLPARLSPEQMRKELLSIRSLLAL